jgi:polysaccharide export outer membrane protein
MTGSLLRTATGASLCLLLAACNLPRGAGLQSEVLRASSGTSSDGTQVQDFAVEPVVRDELPRLLAWPRPGQGRWAGSSGRTAPRTGSSARATC